VSKPRRTPLESLLDEDGVLVLDGGLATELEGRGLDLDHPLWSARVLRDAPEAIMVVHRAYLEAGADCITTASYQATFEGFALEGLSHSEAGALFQRSVELALAARDAFWSQPGNRPGRQRPIVAASIGPYGAYLANGAEYTGAYELSEADLVAFHRERFKLLADTGADLLACETIPSALEARALARLLDEAPSTLAWFSFSCRDGERISDGTPFADCVRGLASHPQIVALGVNCTAPRFVESLLRTAANVTAKPLVAYPNSGERYEAATRRWRGTSSTEDWGRSGQAWRAAGARLIGGCCRTGPGHIRSLRAALKAAAPGAGSASA
jgi:homocysteine S-methyltransferase